MGAQVAFEDPQAGNSCKRGSRDMGQATVGPDGINDCQKDQGRNCDSERILRECRHRLKAKVDTLVVLIRLTIKWQE